MSVMDGRVPLRALRRHRCDTVEDSIEEPTHLWGSRGLGPSGARGNPIGCAGRSTDSRRQKHTSPKWKLLPRERRQQNLPQGENVHDHAQGHRRRTSGASRSRHIALS